MAPWDAFEPKAKDLINLFDEPITLIDGQIKAFEEGRIAQKKALIEAIYTELVGDLADIIHWSGFITRNGKTPLQKKRQSGKRFSAGDGSADCIGYHSRDALGCRI